MADSNTIHIHNYSGTENRSEEALQEIPIGTIIAEFEMGTDSVGWNMPTDKNNEVPYVNFKAGKTYQVVELEA